ncbi:MAG: thioredoxin domain-containing protein [Bryobacteraceae bacterium]
MRLALIIIAGALAAGAQDWKSATELPGVNFTGLDAAKKDLVLNVLRDYGCTCGCAMKVAQCRIEDPPCGQSQALAAMAVPAARQGASAADLRKLLDESEYSRRAKMRTRLLWDPVEIPIQGAPGRGPAGAKVTLVEFSDFQCPYCAVAVGHLNKVLAAFPKDVRLVYKQFPLDSHSNARLAAAASLAAHRQGKFWPLHDRMYANFRAIDRDRILAWAREIGVDEKRFIADMDAPGTDAIVKSDIGHGWKAGVEGTPTVFVNGKKYQGSLEPEALGKVIQAELSGAPAQ